MNHVASRDWIVFGSTIGVALAVDQAIFHRYVARVSVRRALIESASWIALSLAFGAWVYWSLGANSGMEFFAGYVLEKSLSLDNIFVFLLIFASLRIPAEFQAKALYGGILGALLLRAAFVIAGIKLLAIFHAFAYVLGAFLFLVAIRMLLPGARMANPEKSWLLRMARKVFPVTDRYDGGKFFLREGGKLMVTPILLALVILEAMDIVFAADSIPAVLSITRSTFIAYSSNAFAVLGLRALYFAVAGIFPRFRYLREAIALILAFAGVKLALSSVVRVSSGLSLIVICAILAIAIVASIAGSGTKPQKQ
ncbi:MAG TPA: TerC/Alx family metal homeostasis membrane protein [Candidatus Acidoferrum sp.]|nr:TerC/Alx family metal homeostasis membrane protein [Candidatus Acidoferrum sp.]